MKMVYATAAAMVNGSRVDYGSHWPANDPLVVANPGLFSDDPRVGLSTSAPLRDDDAPVETVTAGPGEQRSRVRRG